MANYIVTSDAQLTSAISKSVGGDTIQLSGSFSCISLYQKTFSAAVTITSLDASAPAHIDNVSINAVSNLTLSNVDIGRALTPTEAEWTQMAVVRDSANIILDHVNIHGSIDGNYANDGYGLFASNTDHLVVTGSTFTEETKGLVVQQMTNLQLDNNRFIDMRSDAINVAASNNVLVDSNFFQGFHPIAGDHADAIQFYNLGQPHGSSDIVIRNNVLMPGGVGPQGVWIADGDTYGYTNVTIQNNLLWSDGLYNGIGVFNTTGLNILGNTVTSPTTDDKRFWIRVGLSSDVHINSNVADDLIIDAGVTGLQQSANTFFSTNPDARSLLHNVNTPISASDLITPGVGYQIPVTSLAIAPLPSPVPAPNPDPIPVPAPAPAPTAAPINLIYGTTGNDVLHGTSGADKIWGVAAVDPALGRGRVDQLWGAGGADTFVLGDARGRFYDDGQARNSGKSDYAQIMDFAAGDKIQLHGTVDQYYMKSASVGGLSGVQIFFDSNGNHQLDSRDELIGHVVGVTSLTPDVFVFG